MLPKPKVAFFLCILLLCSICVVFFFFLLNLKGTALCIVYKLNEDEMIILYKHSREQSAQPHRAGLLTAQTWASTDGPGGRLEKSRGPTHCPSPPSLPSRAPVPSLLALFPRSWVVVQMNSAPELCLSDCTLTQIAHVSATLFSADGCARPSQQCGSLPGCFGQGHPRRADTRVLRVLVGGGSLPGPGV